MNKLKPNPNVIHPVKNHYDVIYLKNINNNKKVSIGDFTYVSQSSFKNNIMGNYDWIEDKLVIGKYCQIGKDVRFLLNGVNHEMNCISTIKQIMDWLKSTNIEEAVNKINKLVNNTVK